MSALGRLAHAAGIEARYVSYRGDEVRAQPATQRVLLGALGFEAQTDAGAQAALHDLERRRREELPPVLVVTQGSAPELPPRHEIVLEDGSLYAGSLDALPLGYHRAASGGRECRLIVAPGRCYLPPAMRDRGIWALATQLYALRSERNWGIGDFGDLQAFGEMAARAGARAIALNPLHELHPSDPDAASPYAPSSRLFLNVLYIDVERAARRCEFAEIERLVREPAFARRLAELRAAPLVAYAGVAALKLDALARMNQAIRALGSRHPRAAAFRRFVRSGGTALERLAVFETLDEHFRTCGLHDWQHWPSGYGSPEDSAVAAFVRERAERVDFHRFLQWLAHEQLGETAASCRRAGAVLYRDLAVGADRNGADVWSDGESLVAAAALGAPPDELNALGQNWGLPPFSPRTLRERGYEPFAALLRANMRDAGILRFDHVMALQRAFWIPRGLPASEVAYVRYDLREMLAVLALESVRNRCAVVGEDLGTVPEGFRERLHAHDVLTTSVLYFARDYGTGSFLPPQDYPRLSAAGIGTHDLPTLAGWWTAGDVAARREIALYPTPEAAHLAAEERERERASLVEAFERAGALDATGAAALRADAERGGTLEGAPALNAAAERFLAGAPSLILTLSAEDVLGEPEAVNVPGTLHEHPNWRRKRSLALEDPRMEAALQRAGRNAKR
jgi:(1->4)-alpha-D-glucan 1-alpha-D-glucosylmutase